jgi:undecaprenyl-diphosphatase
MAAREQLSQAVARRRPPTDRRLVRPHGYSYPSRHATAAALGLSVLARSLPQSRRVSGKAVVAGLTGAVGASRVYLGVHWSTDVVGAWLFAASWLAAVDAVERTFWRLAPGGWPPVKGLR